jgi:hypothetical protein
MPVRADRPTLFPSEGKEMRNKTNKQTNKHQKNEKQKDKKQKQETKKQKNKNKNKRQETKNKNKKQKQKTKKPKKSINPTTKTQKGNRRKQRRIGPNKKKKETARKKGHSPRLSFLVVDFDSSAYNLSICANELSQLADNPKVIQNRDRRLSTASLWVAPAFSIKCSPQRKERRRSEPHS